METVEFSEACLSFDGSVEYSCSDAMMYRLVMPNLLLLSYNNKP